MRQAVTQLIDCLNDCLIDCLIECLIDCIIDYLPSIHKETPSESAKSPSTIVAMKRR
jgi:hypothetical protein